MTAPQQYRQVAEAAWRWVQAQVREDDGPWLPDAVVEGATPDHPAWDRDSLYSGIAGLSLLLAELRQHRPLTGAEGDLAARVVDRLRSAAAERVEPSLYDGLAGDATALRLLAPGAEVAPLHRLVQLATPAGWLTTLPYRA